MAQQKSFIKLEGKIGDLTFFKTKDGYQAREKGGVSADRIASDPAFSRTRENNAEFGRACEASKQMRTVLRSIILLTSDNKMTNRLTSRMSRIIKADTMNVRGERKVLSENMGLLKHFNFNAAAVLSSTIFADYQVDFDSSTGQATFSIAAINPDVAIVKPNGATHYQFTVAAARIDFEGEGSALATTELPYHSLNSSTAAQEINLELGSDSELPVLLILGIGFYQEVNGVQYSLKNGAYNAISIISVQIS